MMQLPSHLENHLINTGRLASGLVRGGNTTGKDGWLTLAVLDALKTLGAVRRVTQRWSHAIGLRPGIDWRRWEGKKWLLPCYMFMLQVPNLRLQVRDGDLAQVGAMPDECSTTGGAQCPDGSSGFARQLRSHSIAPRAGGPARHLANSLVFAASSRQSIQPLPMCSACVSLGICD